jgi:hypothetical protein
VIADPVCKTSTPGSNPGGASNLSSMNLRIFELSGPEATGDCHRKVTVRGARSGKQVQKASVHRALLSP